MFFRLRCLLPSGKWLALNCIGFFLRDKAWLVVGIVMEVCFAAIVTLPVLRGPPLERFLVYFLVASAAYAVAVFLLGRASCSLRGIWVFAILFRLTILLTSPPTLSDDVYRYIWDGRLVNAGVSPYAHAVDSRILDGFDSPQRALVNNAWMASPYLPASQAFFGAVYRVAPDSTFAFQVTAVLFDLLAGWLVADLLRLLSLPRTRALIYLWNPLAIVEFAHGAHVDALMICLMVASLWALVAAHRCVIRSLIPSVIALAAATLTKGIPVLLVPVVAWYWGRGRSLLYAALVTATLVPFVLGAGLGLTGPPDGEGLFGALRIYGEQWNYNSGLYHWLEVGLSGYRTPGAVPPEVVGKAPVRSAKLTMAAVLGLVLIVVAGKARRCEDEARMLRLAAVSLSAYLMLTTTVHPWYVTVIIPLLPFLLPKECETTRSDRFIWPWIYLSAAVGLSYLTYLAPADFREYDWVRLMEYAPFYLLLIWAAWPASGSVRRSALD